MRPARAKAAKINYGENRACAKPHLQSPGLPVDPRQALALGPLTRSSPLAGLARARYQRRLILRGELDQDGLADRPYGSPARRGDAFSLPNDFSTVACVFQAARAIPPGNPLAGTIRSGKCSSNFAGSRARTFPYLRGQLSWPCPAQR